MKNDKIDTLTEEIRNLRKEVRELREASQWPRIQYVPVPNYVPHYPQPSWYPWWGNSTIAVTPCTTTTWTIGNNAGSYSTTGTVPMLSAGGNSAGL